MKTFVVFLILIFATSPLAAAKEDAIEAIVPDDMERVLEGFQYSPAVRAGDYIFVSGIVAWLPKDENGDLVEATPEVLEASFVRAFDRLATVLEAAGASWGDVVDMTSFHTDLRGHGEVFIEVKKHMSMSLIRPGR